METKKIGLVLSGGGARGLFAVRVLQRLQKAKFDFTQLKCISGVSVGSIIGAMVVQGDLDILINMFQNIQNKDVYKGKISLKRIVWNRIMGKNHVLDVEPLHGLLWKYIDLDKAKKGPVFYIGVTDLTTGKFRTFTQHDFNTKEDYIRCIMASCSQPVIWAPQKFETRFETVISGSDGGVVTISPIKCVLDSGVDEVIIINSCPTNILIVDELKTMESVLLRTIDLAIAQSFLKDMEDFEKFNKLAKNNKNIVRHNGYRYYPSTIYQTNLHEDSLNFDDLDLKQMRIDDADRAFEQTYNENINNIPNIFPNHGNKKP